MTQTTRRAADHLIDLLIAQGASHIFGVPGESYLPLLDALYARAAAPRFITCRQEGGAAMAAEAHGKLTNRPGLCMVTRGPGATNASAGLHVAFQDSTPMILFIGQVGRGMIEREAFQEVDYRRMFGPMAKWVAQIDDPARLQEYICRAYRVAMAGRPGPVVLALPEDMLAEEITPPPPPAFITAPRYRPDGASLAAFRAALEAAERPLVIAGGGGWTPRAQADFARFIATQGLPVAASFRAQALMDNDSPHYVGHFAVAQDPGLAQAVRAADLVIAFGARLGEITTAGYQLLSPPVPAQKLIHIHSAPEEPGHVYAPDLVLVADMESLCAELAPWPRCTPDPVRAHGARLRAGFETYNSPDAVPGDPLAPLFTHLAEALPPDAIVTNGAGNYAGWLHRFYRYRRPGSQLAPTSGSMGYGLPAAVAAAAQGGREVVAVAGDGCFMMTCQELATACQYGLSLTVIVVDNGRYGTIRAHQERHFPGRVSGTDLGNPDFAAMARSFGAWAATVATPEAFAPALAQARAHSGPALIHVTLGAEMLAPGKRLG